MGQIIKKLSVIYLLNSLFILLFLFKDNLNSREKKKWIKSILSWKLIKIWFNIYCYYSFDN